MNATNNIPERIVYVYGIKCTVKKAKCLDGIKRDEYTFTVPGWEQCSIIGLNATKRVINGRLNAAVRNTMGMD